MAHRLDLKVGFACNNHCRFCVQGDKRSRFANKPSDELRATLREGRARGDSVVFTGGEPTLRKDLPLLIAYARQLGYRTIQIQTNARRLAAKSYAELLVRCGANEFAPSLHGPTAEIHDLLTEAPGSFAQTVVAIQNLKALGQYVLTNSVITRDSYRRLPELAELLVSLGVDQMQFAFVHPLGTAAARFLEIVPSMTEIGPFLKEALQRGLDAGRPVMAEAVPYCILDGYEECVAERSIPPTTIVDAEGTIEDYTRYRIEEGKAKGPECRGCAYGAVCEGPWREYPEKFGWDEFRPVRRHGECTESAGARRGDQPP